MDSHRQQAYLTVLAASLLYVKWDLACWYGGFAWFRPWNWRHLVRAASRAAYRSATFHNLAIFTTHDFVGFSEEYFWKEVDRFHNDFPETHWNNYRGIFDRCLRGEEVHIVKPGG